MHTAHINVIHLCLNVCIFKECQSNVAFQVRDWLRVIASNKDRNVYELRYFNIADNEAEDEE